MISSSKTKTGQENKDKSLMRKPFDFLGFHFLPPYIVIVSQAIFVYFPANVPHHYSKNQLPNLVLQNQHLPAVPFRSNHQYDLEFEKERLKRSHDELKQILSIIVHVTNDDEKIELGKIRLFNALTNDYTKTLLNHLFEG